MHSCRSLPRELAVTFTPATLISSSPMDHPCPAGRRASGAVSAIHRSPTENSSGSPNLAQSLIVAVQRPPNVLPVHALPSLAWQNESLVNEPLSHLVRYVEPRNRKAVPRAVIRWGRNEGYSPCGRIPSVIVEDTCGEQAMGLCIAPRVRVHLPSEAAFGGSVRPVRAKSPPGAPGTPVLVLQRSRVPRHGQSLVGCPSPYRITVWPTDPKSLALRACSLAGSRGRFARCRLRPRSSSALPTWRWGRDRRFLGRWFLGGRGRSP